jgi:hypothetical protein
LAGLKEARKINQSGNPYKMSNIKFVQSGSNFAKFTQTKNKYSKFEFSNSINKNLEQH